MLHKAGSKVSLRMLPDSLKLIHTNFSWYVLCFNSSHKHKRQSPKDLHISNYLLYHLTDRSRLTLSFFNSPSISISKVGYIALYWLANTLNLEGKKCFTKVSVCFPPHTPTNLSFYWLPICNYLVIKQFQTIKYLNNYKQTI